jgi:hypothetical protein
MKIIKQHRKCGEMTAPIKEGSGWRKYNLIPLR